MKHALLSFAAGLALGLVAGLAIEFGLPGAITAVVIVVLVGRLLPRWSGLAGGLAGLGVLWLALFTRAALECAGRDQPCGATPPDELPWIALSVILLVGSAVAVGATVRRNASARDLG